MIGFHQVKGSVQSNEWLTFAELKVQCNQVSGSVQSKKAFDIAKREALLMFFFAFAIFLFVFRRTTIGIREKRCKFVAEIREGEKPPLAPPGGREAIRMASSF